MNIDNKMDFSFKTKYCQKCRSSNELEAKTCCSCGHARFWHNLHEFAQDYKLICWDCGEERDPDSECCEVCGQTAVMADSDNFTSIELDD